MDPELLALWRTVYADLAHRAAHELNNALNGVAMNLEVARLRAVPDADAGRVAPFAAAAAESHEEVVALVKPLLALARAPLTAVCDVREVAEQVIALLAPGVRTNGSTLALAGDAGLARTAASPAAVLVAVACVLTTATRVPGSAVTCVVTASREPTLALTPPGALAIGRDVTRALERAGIRSGTDPVAWTLTFPSA